MFSTHTDIQIRVIIEGLFYSSELKKRVLVFKGTPQTNNFVSLAASLLLSAVAPSVMVCASVSVSGERHTETLMSD